MRTWVLAAALTFAAGCSFFLKGVPEGWTPATEPDCQPYIIVPLVDGALGLGVTAWALGSPCRDGVLGCAFALAGGAAVIAAGIYGYLKVKKCQEANEAFEATKRLEGRAGPPWLAPVAGAPPP